MRNLRALNIYDDIAARKKAPALMVSSLIVGREKEKQKDLRELFFIDFGRKSRRLSIPARVRKKSYLPSIFIVIFYNALSYWRERRILSDLSLELDECRKQNDC